MNEILSRSPGFKKISRITLGAMEDMGYIVNYTAADPYGTDDIGTCSACSGTIPVRRLRTSETVPVPAASKSSYGHSGAAMQYGKNLHRNM